MTPAERITTALEIANQYGGIDGDHHKMWVIDQMVRVLNDAPVVAGESVDVNGVTYTYTEWGKSDAYKAWVAAHCNGEDGPSTYEWDEGIAP